MVRNCGKVLQSGDDDDDDEIDDGDLECENEMDQY